MWLALRAAVFGRTDRKPVRACGSVIYLSGMLGEQPFWVGATQFRRAEVPLSPQVPIESLVEFLLPSLLPLKFRL